MSQIPISTRTREVAIRLTPRREGWLRSAAQAQAQASGELLHVYDAWIYAAEPIGDFKLPDSDRVPAVYNSVGGLPLVGLEHVTIRWNRYQEYLSEFLEGEKGAHELGEKLFRTLSDGLQNLFDLALADSGGRVVRLWWASKTPELEDLPWELMAYSRVRPPTELTFVRGIPPDTPPLTPAVAGRLRLALIYDPGAGTGPSELLTAIDSLNQRGIVEVVRYGSNPRKALRQAAAEGVEMVHIIADGFVSMSYDGILYLHQPQREELHPEIGAGELMSTLLGSRVSLIGLTASQPTDPDTMLIAGQEVPSVYRAFACLGATRQPLPTMVAPLGPVFSYDVGSFWSGFYQGLAETLHIHKALAQGRAGRLLPFAVFLRQRFSRLFTRAGADPADLPSLGARKGEDAPAAMAAQLESSQALIEDVQELRERTGDLPAETAAFLERESKRHAVMQERLDRHLRSSGQEVE